MGCPRARVAAVLRGSARQTTKRPDRRPAPTTEHTEPTERRRRVRSARSVRWFDKRRATFITSPTSGFGNPVEKWLAFRGRPWPSADVHRRLRRHAHNTNAPLLYAPCHAFGRIIAGAGQIASFPAPDFAVATCVQWCRGAAATGGPTRCRSISQTPSVAF